MHATGDGLSTAIEEARAAERSGATDRALALFTEVLHVLGAAPGVTRVDVLRWIGTIHRERGRPEEAAAYYARSLQDAEVCSYRGGIAHGLNCRAILAHREGRMDEALELYRHAAAEAAGVGDHRLLGMVEQNVAVIHGTRGETEQALLRFRMASRAFEEAGDEEAMGWVLNNLGVTYRQRRELAAAEAAFLRGLSLVQKQGDGWAAQALLLNYADVLADGGEHARAEELCEQALVKAELRQDRVRMAEALKRRARFRGRRDGVSAALTDLSSALDHARGTGNVQLTAEVLADLGSVQLRTQDVREARRSWTEAHELFVRAGATREAAEVSDFLRHAPARPTLI
jgi:tetratricopeptide (TPR) repeat protein